MYLPSKSQLAKACAFALLASASVGQAPANAEFPTSGSLTVQASGLQNTNGQVCFSLYNSSVGFPNDPEAIVANQCVSAAAEPSVVFSDLGMGTYAVSVLHDENEDMQINQGTFGIPTEGFGFSRNPAPRAGAPEFYETAVFLFGKMTTEIEMVYF